MRIVKTTGLSQATRWGMERVCERWNVIIQQRQTPLNTYRVLLWRPLSQREKDLEKKPGLQLWRCLQRIGSVGFDESPIRRQVN